MNPGKHPFLFSPSSISPYHSFPTSFAQLLLSSANALCHHCSFLQHFLSPSFFNVPSRSLSFSQTFFALSLANLSPFQPLTHFQCPVSCSVFLGSFLFQLFSTHLPRSHPLSPLLYLVTLSQRRPSVSICCLNSLHTFFSH